VSTTWCWHSNGAVLEVLVELAGASLDDDEN
jgi:hypothetical protein